MKILAVDTSSAICSVALLEDDKKIDVNELNDGKTHSENLMPLIDEILTRNAITLKDIDLYSVVVGPGSFTGIRIGVATIKPMAEINNKKVASVTSLETLARNVENANIIVSLIDAKNNQVYCGIFDSNYNKLEDYLADDINIVLDSIKKYENVTFVGNGSVLHKELIDSVISNANYSDNNDQSAVCTGIIGFKKYNENDLETADSIIPKYLRKSQAERLKK